MSSSGQAPGNPFDPTREMLQSGAVRGDPRAMSIEEHIALAEHQLKMAARDRRDRYIQAALTGLLANGQSNEYDVVWVARYSVKHADAVIAEADKEPQS
jgi:hypothetical protein